MFHCPEVPGLNAPAVSLPAWPVWYLNHGPGSTRALTCSILLFSCTFIPSKTFTPLLLLLLPWVAVLLLWAPAPLLLLPVPVALVMRSWMLAARSAGCLRAPSIICSTPPLCVTACTQVHVNRKMWQSGGLISFVCRLLWDRGCMITAEASCAYPAFHPLQCSQT
jgi:hypothetical protein